ncbi:hypothetical protein ACGFJT_37450 [Actinomadura geliboluensis]|uniref:hypothetical protein n=1 Tax=Actinomadura geliboluensis TaxID=882440 RepID=UPI003712B065
MSHLDILCRPANACLPGETTTLDGVTIPRHTFSCPDHNSDGPRWYVWQGFDEPTCLEAGTLADFARAWALSWHGAHVAGTAIEPIEVRTWDRTCQAVISEKETDTDELHGHYLVTVEEESVIEFVELAAPSRT